VPEREVGRGQGILEHTDPEIVRKSLKLKFKKDMAF
jgi:hypothetical protein